MAKQGEIDYLRNIGHARAHHAARKPFSDPFCGGYLVEIGAVFDLLPQPPGRLLDLGCGTGWTSRFFAKRGYEVIGVDIAPDMIEVAIEAGKNDTFRSLGYLASDYEGLTFDNEFDSAVFFDSLHHATDEVAAIRSAYRALKPGGVLITSEPGKGHADQPKSKEAMMECDVTEKDMPPTLIRRLGKEIGFRRSMVFPHAYGLSDCEYRCATDPLKRPLLHALRSGLKLAHMHTVGKHASGIVALIK